MVSCGSRMGNGVEGLGLGNINCRFYYVIIALTIVLKKVMLLFLVSDL